MDLRNRQLQGARRSFRDYTRAQRDRIRRAFLPSMKETYGALLPGSGGQSIETPVGPLRVQPLGGPQPPRPPQLGKSASFGPIQFGQAQQGMSLNAPLNAAPPPPSEMSLSGPANAARPPAPAAPYRPPAVAARATRPSGAPILLPPPSDAPAVAAAPSPPVTRSAATPMTVVPRAASAGPIGDPQAAAARFRAGVEAERAQQEATRLGLLNQMGDVQMRMQALGDAELGRQPETPPYKFNPHFRNPGRVSLGEFRGPLPSDLEPRPERQPSFNRALPDLNAADDGMTRINTGDGYVVAGPGVDIGPDGMVMTPGGRQVVMPRSGTSLGLRTRDPDTGAATTESGLARTVRSIEQRDPGEDGQLGASAQRFMDYLGRRQDRRDSALELRREANALRGQGQMGALAGVVPGAAGGAVGFNQPVFGRFGPALEQAAGLVRRERGLLNRAEAQKDREFLQGLLGDVIRTGVQGDANERVARAQGEAQADIMRNRLAMEAMLSRLPEPSNAAEQAEIDYNAALYRKQLERMNEADPVTQEIADWVDIAKFAPPDETAVQSRGPMPTQIVNYALQIMNEDQLSDDAKKQLLRMQGIESYQDLERMWNQSSQHDKYPWQLFSWQDERALDRYRQLFGD